jgi:hypothetical protein
MLWRRTQPPPACTGGGCMWGEHRAAYCPAGLQLSADRLLLCMLSGRISLCPACFWHSRFGARNCCPAPSCRRCQLACSNQSMVTALGLQVCWREESGRHPLLAPPCLLGPWLGTHPTMHAHHPHAYFVPATVCTTAACETPAFLLSLLGAALSICLSVCLYVCVLRFL